MLEIDIFTENLFVRYIYSLNTSFVRDILSRARDKKHKARLANRTKNDTQLLNNNALTWQLTRKNNPFFETVYGY